MPSDVVCMALANAPSGEQMSRFLAVGLNDNTVRIVSLDPSVNFENNKIGSCMFDLFRCALVNDVQKHVRLMNRMITVIL